MNKISQWVNDLEKVENELLRPDCNIPTDLSRKLKLTYLGSMVTFIYSFCISDLSFSIFCV